MKNSELSERLGLPHTRVKRWAREFLGADKTAGQRTGYARDYGLNEGFEIFLGGHLVSDLGFSVDETKEILKELRPWMEKVGIFPESTYKRRGELRRRDEKVRRYSIKINRSEGGPWFTAIGHAGTEEVVEDGITFIQERRTFEVVTLPKGVSYGASRTLELEILLGIFLKRTLGEEEGIQVWFKGRPGRNEWHPDWEEFIWPITLEEAKKQIALGREIAQIANK